MRIVGGRWRGRRLQAPPTARPTAERARAGLMSHLAERLAGARVLDLFAGSGALGLEALSRGARHVTFVERDPRALRALKENLATLGAGERARIVRADVRRFLAALPEGAFELALADPPYDRGWATWLLQRFAERPFAAYLCVEHSRRELLPTGPGVWQRRYGDTVWTCIAASASPSAPDPSTPSPSATRKSSAGPSASSTG